MNIGKIDGVMNAYKASSLKKPVEKKENPVSTGAKRDRVEFDFDRSLNGAKANVLSDLKRELSASEVEEIKADLSANENLVDDEKLVDYILTL
ncbi:MAG: hypothetical protein GX346_02430 [Clostridiales bacterium]|nr:hypothetical protein [Clostridiales bacterium]